MKKKYLVLTFISAIILGGCQTSSVDFLSFKDTVSISVLDSNINSTEYDFFSKELVIIPEEVKSIPDDSFHSEAALLLNITDQETLYANNMYDQMYPASLTKLASALVVLKRGTLTDTVTISKTATVMPEANAKVCGFKPGDKISLDSLLHSMLIYSGNDASIAVAEHLAGSEEQFVKLMNEEAKTIGAVHSNFTNSHGLHNENHYSTAYDIYLIFNELIKYDVFREIIGIKSYTIEYRDSDNNVKTKTFPTTNLYLKGEKQFPDDLTLYGGKTGTTSKAGNCLIMLTKDKQDKEYISLILKASGEANLYKDMDLLISATFD